MAVRARALRAPLTGAGVSDLGRRRATKIVLLAAGMGLLVAVTLIALGARGSGALAIGVTAAVATGVIAYPMWGFCFLLFVAILADRHLWRFSPWTDELGFYVFQSWRTVLSPADRERFGLLMANSVDLLVLSLLLGLLLSIVRRRARFQVSADGVIGLLALLTVGAMFGYGLLSGGDLKPALWQVRPLVHLLVFGLVGAQLLTTAAVVGSVIPALVAATFLKALQINWIFFVDEAGRFGTWREILGHEDSIFLVAVIALGLACLLYRTRTSLRVVLLLAMPFLAAALVLNLRRGAYVALALSLLLMPLTLHGRRRAALAVVASLGLLVGLYGAVVSSHRAGGLSVPLSKVKSIVSAAPGTTDFTSNAYRDAENYNLQRTLTARPLGLGFGHPFEIHVPLADLSFLMPLWRYHPHNMVLGIWIAVGSVGFIIVLTYLGGLIMLASHTLRWHADPQVKAISYFSLASLLSALLVTATDQFIWSDRGALFLGAVAAVVSVLYRNLGRQRADTAVPCDAAAGRTVSRATVRR